MKQLGLAIKLVVLSAAISFALWFVSWAPIEAIFYDWLVVTFPATKVTDDVVLVELDDPFLDRTERVVPLETHKNVLRKILKGDPKKLVILSSSDNTFFFHSTPQQLVEFYQSLSSKRIRFGINELYENHVDEIPGIPAEYRQLPFEPWPIAHDSRGGVNDGVSRTAVFQYKHIATGAKIAADELRVNPLPLDKVFGGFTLYGAHKFRIRYAKRDSFKKLSYDDVLNLKSSELFENKYILLGRVSEVSMYDRFPTPLQQVIGGKDLISVLELQANVINNMIYNLGVLKVPSQWIWSVVFLLSLFGGWVALSLTPQLGPFVVVTVSSLILSSSILLFVLVSLYLPVFVLLSAFLISYFVMIPIRLIQEEKRSRGEMILFARQVGHDIRSPLSALKVLSQVLEQVPAKQKKMFVTATDRIESIAETLLGMNEKNTDSPQGPLDIKLCIEEVIAEKKIEHGEICTFTLSINKGEDDHDFFWDISPIDFKRVLSNLINNAVESYDGLGGEVILQLSRHKTLSQIEVIDHGKGISPQDLKSFGTPGFTKGKGPGGHGLGVAGSMTIVKAYNGDLSYSSKEGEGTIASITWVDSLL